jgi:hypothetical protein
VISNPRSKIRFAEGDDVNDFLGGDPISSTGVDFVEAGDDAAAFLV